MDYLKIDELLYEYFLRDKDGNVEAIQKALEGVSLRVKKGDFISILGHNGSGKSTLAKLINALLTPAEGTVVVDGMDTKDPDNTLSIRKKTGMVFQNPDNQIIASVVEEDVAFGPENIGTEPGEIRKRVKSSLETLSMLEFAHKSPNHLSGGQKQRVAIAGILAMEPKCIILDEATAMLDPRGAMDVIEVAHRLNKEQGMTIILITHNMEETIGSDYIYVMDKGRVVMEGSPREVFAKGDELAMHGLCVPQITLVADMLRARGVNIAKGILDRGELAAEIARIAGHADHS